MSKPTSKKTESSTQANKDATVQSELLKQEPESDTLEGKEPERKQPESKEPESKELESKEPESKELEIKESENKELESKEMSDLEPSASKPEEQTNPIQVGSDNKLSKPEAYKQGVESNLKMAFKVEDKDSLLATDVSIICDDKKDRHKQEPASATSKRGYQLMLVLALFFAFIVAMGYQTFFGTINRPAGDMLVEEGQSYYGLLPQFQRDVPMFSAMMAKMYIKAKVDNPLQAGTYDLPQNPNLIEIISVLEQGQSLEMVKLQIIEGKTAKDLYKVLANTNGIYLEVLNKNGMPKPNIKNLLNIDAYTPEGEFNNNLEGWFAPNTYHYAHGVTDTQILVDLYKRQKKALDKAWENRAEGLPYKTPYEALIMASIIEKETSVKSERELVSAVFVNRINKGMRLQTDPTIIYGMGERYDGDIRRKDINEKTAYNTYQIDGLPPTPIALPSFASIEAAMHPADSDALYFVATGKGGHKFSKTLAEHNKAVQDYLKVIRSKKSQPTS